MTADKHTTTSRIQFSLSHVLLLVALVCVTVGWIANERRWTTRQREAISPFIWDYDDSCQVTWYQWLVGERRTQCAVMIDGVWRELELKDSDLVYLNGMASLKRLYLSDLKITDAGISSMHNVPSLDYLSLVYTSISDQSLEHLGKRFAHLRKLTLDGTRITDGGLLHLRSMTNLQLVTTENCPGITPEGRQKLRQLLPKCEVWP